MWIDIFLDMPPGQICVNRILWVAHDFQFRGVSRLLELLPLPDSLQIPPQCWQGRSASAVQKDCLTIKCNTFIRLPSVMSPWKPVLSMSLLRDRRNRQDANPLHIYTARNTEKSISADHFLPIYRAKAWSEWCFACCNLERFLFSSGPSAADHLLHRSELKWSTGWRIVKNRDETWVNCPIQTEHKCYLIHHVQVPAPFQFFLLKRILHATSHSQGASMPFLKQKAVWEKYGSHIKKAACYRSAHRFSTVETKSRQENNLDPCLFISLPSATRNKLGRRTHLSRQKREIKYSPKSEWFWLTNVCWKRHASMVILSFYIPCIAEVLPTSL